MILIALKDIIGLVLFAIVIVFAFTLWLSDVYHRWAARQKKVGK